jgi:hypothetical protein
MERKKDECFQRGVCLFGQSRERMDDDRNHTTQTSKERQMGSSVTEQTHMDRWIDGHGEQLKE